MAKADYAMIRAIGHGQSSFINFKKGRGADVIWPRLFCYHEVVVQVSKSLCKSLAFQGHRFAIEGTEGSSDRQDLIAIVGIDAHGSGEIEGAYGNAQLRTGR